ncbi:hypothetical protein FRC15_001098 [Serendipita sp. 397]|nr:hypothetical protein FRC15_001098 [Serendipita sp. 397]
MMLAHPPWEGSADASPYSCDVAVAMITICSFLQMLVAHIIFTMRIYTLSHAYPQFQIFVVAALVITQAASTVLAAFTIKEVLPSFTYYPQGDTCIYLTQANNIYSALMMILSVALETLIFVATIYYTVRYQRTLSVLEGARSISILKRLSLHGSQFFVLVILSHVSTILSLYFIPLGIQLLVPTFNYFFTSMLVSRFVLSLQREIFDSKNPEESGIQMTGPSIVLTRTPITFLYSEHRFGSDVDVGDDDDHGGGNGFGPETFTSMTSLGRFKQNEEPETDMEMRRFSKALGSRERIPNQ